MCFQTRRKHYTYLSMCSCCHFISKYSSVVKSHLLHDHAKHSSKNGTRVVIPIRIDSKYEKHLALRLDKKSSLQSQRNTNHRKKDMKESIKTVHDESISKTSNKRNKTGEKSILCIICKKSFSSLVKYFSHLSVKDHVSTEVGFRCTHCESQFHNLQDLVHHNEKEHSMKKCLTVTQFDCTKRTVDDVKHSKRSSVQCPYCLNMFTDIKKLYQHMGGNHCDQIDYISIKSEEVDGNESQDQNTVVVVYKCMHCNECFHGLRDIMQHVTDVHVPVRQTRKRKKPKWLQEQTESEKIPVKRMKNDASSKKQPGIKDMCSKDQSNKKSSGERTISHKKVDKNLVPGLQPVVALRNIESFDKRKSSEKRNASAKRALEIFYQNEKKNKKNDKEFLVKITSASEHNSDDEEENPKNVIEENNGSSSPEYCTDDIQSADSYGDPLDEFNDNELEGKNETAQTQNEISKSGMLKCPYCNLKEYLGLKSLKRHIKAKHAEYAKLYAEDGTEVQNSVGKDMENACQETFKEDMIDDELEGDSDDDYNPEEDNTTDSEKEIQKEVELLSFKCEYCADVEYTKRKSLHQHIRSKHPEDFYIKHKVKKSSIKKINDTDITTMFKCPFCAFSLYHREYVFSHIERVHSEVLHFTVADIVKKQVEVNENPSERECFKCPYCKFVCRWKLDITSHFRDSHPTLKKPKQIPCIMPASWLDNQTISANLMCGICKSVFEGKKNFENHMKEHISNEGMNMIFQSTLPEPKRFGKQPFKKRLQSFLCPLCDSVFKRKDSYMYHLKSHMGGTQKKDDITAIKCIVLKKNPSILSVDHWDKSKSKYIDADKFVSDESLNVNNELKEETDDNTDKVNVAPSKNMNKKDSDQMSKEVKNISDCIEGNRSSINEMERDLKIVHIDSDSPKDHTTYLNINTGQSKLEEGSFICPICDDFKTFSKSLAVKHVEESHSSKMYEIEILHIVPHVYLEKYNHEKDEFTFGCESCSFSTDTTVHAVKHIKSHRNKQGKEKERTGAEEVLTTKTTESKYFDMVSLPGLEFGMYEDVVHKCWSCHPNYLLKTKKGYRKHMLSYHKDEIGCEVGDVMNQMLGLIEGKKGDNYRCTICSEILKTRGDLIDHYKERYPDKVDDLMAQLNSRKNIANTPDSAGYTECEICYQGYRDDSALRRHLLLHLNKGRIHCATCGIYFRTREEVANHSVSAHSISNYMCSTCGKLLYSSKDFSRHMRQHKTIEITQGKNTTILCQHCGIELRKFTSNLKRHQLRYHANLITCDCAICKKQSVPVGATSCVCTVCKKVFCTNYMLAVHQVNEHPQQHARKKKVHSVTAEFKCVGCALIFDSQKELQLHSHRCGKGVEKVMCQSTQLDEEQERMSECEKKLNYKIELNAEYIKENFLVHNVGAELPYKCGICDKSFRILKYMYNHIRRKHASDETRRFRCKVCKMGFVSSSSLKQHCKSHIGLRLHRCTYCKKSFKSSTHLREHMQIHTDAEEPKYTCGYCGNKFVQNGALLAHVVHHDKTRPYECPYCQKSFTSTGDLKRHMDRYDKILVKKDLKCSFCQKTFKNSHYLLKHFQTHTLQNPFSCSVCQMKFSSFRQMYLHKDKNKHFTDAECKQAREDLQTPGRMFRQRANRKLKAKKVASTSTETANTTSLIDKVPVTFDKESAKFVFDSDSCVEIIQIPNDSSGEQGEATVSALAQFQENVINSMMDVVENKPEEVKIEQEIYNYDDGEQVQYVVEISDSQTQTFDPAIASKSSPGLVTLGTDAVVVANDSTVVDGEAGTNIGELVSLVSQSVPNEGSGRTQTFQTPDGSLIHVCVVKTTK